MTRAIALTLTLLTGFSGLVYQVAWQKYLATLLGSHSEATAAVLGIFLGGLSLGYAWFGAISRARVRAAAGRGGPAGLLPLYGAVEAAIGVWALAFPWLFAAARALSVRLPAGAEGSAFAADVALTALLIGPPTVLMGGTIPLLTQGLSRDLADATRFHSLVYAVNTLGAFAGALAAAFVLIPALGLERAVLCMGGVNLLAGACFLRLRRDEVPPTVAPDAASAAPDLPAGHAAAFAAVVTLAGFAMMSLQTVMNRIGGFALGASHFTFAMVVATCVLCIALGSFAVSALSRVGRAALLLTQWALVASLLLLYLGIEDATYWAHVLRLAFPNEAAAFLPFHAAVLVAVLATFGPPLALSGALLPLLFHELRRNTRDLGSVAGRLYAWNTVGSLLGALLGGYLLLLWLDLADVYRLAVIALAAAAAVSTALLLPRARSAAAAALLAVAALCAWLPTWDAVRLSAGLFRYRQAEPDLARGPDAYFAGFRSEWGDDFVLAYDDDPAASVAVFATGGAAGRPGRAIVTNGKVDGNIPDDDVTTGLLALLPALFAERCERAFVIGYGTGMTVGELAALDSTREVVVAEISRAVIDAAPYFEALNRGAAASPKTRIVRSDAYRALLRSREHFDVIVSEPSNPWVTGVEMLYSVEFLGAARDRLAPGGVYAQWFHAYETDDRSVALVLDSFRSVFPRVAIWYGRGTDLILLGLADERADVDLARLRERWERPDFRRQLAAIGLVSLPRLLAHEILPVGVTDALPRAERVHTILHPILSDATARAFFVGGSGALPASFGRAAAVVGARNALLGRYRAQQGGALSDADRLELLRETCNLDLWRCATLFAQWLHEDPDSPVLTESLARARASERFGGALEPGVLNGLATLFDRGDAAHLPASYAVASDLARVFGRYYHHGAPFEPDALHAVWRRCADVDPRCAAGLDDVLGLGRPETRLSRR